MCEIALKCYHFDNIHGIMNKRIERMTSNMKRIFICSRLRGRNQKELDKHIEQARIFSKYIINKNYGAPFAPHLFYPQFLDDTVDFERKMGIDSGYAYLVVSDALFAFIDESEIVSEGMRSEIQYAVDHGIPVYPYQYTNGRIKPKKRLLNEWKDSWLKVLEV